MLFAVHSCSFNDLAPTDPAFGAAAATFRGELSLRWLAIPPRFGLWTRRPAPALARRTQPSAEKKLKLGMRAIGE
jgi:hypothetical protein